MGRRYRDIVRQHSRAKRSARAVMMLLSDYADDDGIAWPGHERIAVECGLSERTVTRAIIELVEMGEIEIATRPQYHSPSYYRILLAPKCAEQGSQDVYPVDAQGRHPDYHRVDILTEQGRHPVTNRVDILSAYIEEPDQKEPDREPEGKPENVAATPQPDPTPQQEFFAAICEVIGWDYKTLTKDATGRVAQVIGILKKAEYGSDDVRRFMTEVWFQDFRWTEKNQRPTLNVLRNEIGKLRAAVPMDMPIPRNNGRPLSKSEQTMANFDEFRRLKAAGSI